MKTEPMLEATLSCLWIIGSLGQELFLGKEYRM